ncbi:MAG TPA: methylmalonyl Co-A mutase-associated GTPase MeaB [Acidobacteriaceae bacterium]|jgi:LAO/AO transport system kinase|nr:methylmalonyl Co-A mutase-associated GTPase MeaB [Acidobacteriaceae bacterium]
MTAEALKHSAPTRPSDHPASTESPASRTPGASSDKEIQSLVHRLRQGDIRALARAISLVENGAPEARALLSACFAHAAGALRIGITGSPGAGKSTLVDRLAAHYRAAGKTVGVVAVDPSSPFTGGAILGDRIRFQNFTSDPGFYARSMATRGSLGGLAATTADAALVLEASGKEVILIETVGVGQDEIEIARLADITVVVLIPGMGDDVQSLKAGVMEIADIFVVNKSDREGADRVEQEIHSLQSLATGPAHESVLRGHGFSRADKNTNAEGALPPERQFSWTPPVIRTIATMNTGTGELAAAIAALEEKMRTTNHLVERRARHWRRRLDAMLRTELLRRALQHGLTDSQLAGYAKRIAAGHEDPWQLVAQLAQKVFSAGP